MSQQPDSRDPDPIAGPASDAESDALTLPWMLAAIAVSAAAVLLRIVAIGSQSYWSD